MKFPASLPIAGLGLIAMLALPACHRGQQADGGEHHGRGMDFSTMTFPMARADFIARLNARARQRCASRDVQAQQQVHGFDCAALEAGIAKCATSDDVPESILDHEDAHEAAHDYFECVRGD